MNIKNRREFLKRCCALGTAGAGAHLTRLGLISAQAQTTVSPTFKALVCIFFFGGNDSNNMIIPIDSRYNSYSSVRGPVAIPSAQVLAAGSSGFGVHPALTNVQRIYNAGDAALVLNVGTLVRPTTKATLNQTPLPRNLYSHSDQTQQWQSSDPNGGGTGWAGRINDLALIAAGNTGLPPGITLNGGNALFLNGATTKGFNFSNTGSFGLQRFGDGTAMNARQASLQRILTFDSGLQLVAAANGVLGDAMRSAAEINAALNAAPALPVTFPNSGLGNQLAQAFRLISVQSALGMNRQIFFCGMGGFDNHDALLTNQQGLLATVNAAIGPFYDALVARGLQNQVTTFTESEFNRTANSNANIGTDHAWGGNHIAFGGAVTSGAFGTFPTFQLRGPDDAGDRGYWIPTTSLDQYAATFGAWFGVPDSDLRLIFPNLANFNPQRMAFLG